MHLMEKKQAIAGKMADSRAQDEVVAGEDCDRDVVCLERLELLGEGECEPTKRFESRWASATVACIHVCMRT